MSSPHLIGALQDAVCAKPGHMYTQALVEGQRIVLAADGVEFEYHLGGSRGPFQPSQADRGGSASDCPVSSIGSGQAA